MTDLRCLRSPVCQTAGAAIACLIVAALHLQNDGLWYQGDAPRHAANGLFWWDLLTALPADPVGYAASYFARYPIINPAGYPPLFYLLEGFGFAVAGPSPHVAKVLVQLFAMLACVYTMAYARRWIGPAAGWAGTFLAFVPGFVVWSNAVMLNVPATALSIAALYHFRRWLDDEHARQIALAIACAAAAILTYYPAAVVLAILAGWSAMSPWIWRRRRRSLWIAAVLVAAFVPLIAAVILAPVHTVRHLPSWASLSRASAWTFYWTALVRPEAIGKLLLAAGSIGAIAGLTSGRWHRESAYLAAWIVFPTIFLTLLPARDPRYILITAPAFVLAAAVGIARVWPQMARMQPPLQLVALASGLAAAFWVASRVEVPRVTGFREIAEYLQERGPHDAVLYDGHFAGLFGFYFRALDPRFDRQMVRGDKLLYEEGPRETFRWQRDSRVNTVDDVVRMIRTECGCRWIALEVGPRTSGAEGRRLLREALSRPEFTLDRTFAIDIPGDPRVEIYRVAGDIRPAPSVTLAFPSFGNRTFRDVVPVRR